MEGHPSDQAGAPAGTESEETALNHHLLNNQPLSVSVQPGETTYFQFGTDCVAGGPEATVCTPHSEPP